LYVTHETATEQGQQLYDHARRILQEIDDAKGILRSQTSDPTGRVSVGLPTSACRGLSLPLFRVMAERLPNITLHLVEAMTGYLDELIQAGRLDVALLYDHKAFEHVAWTQMITEDLMLFVSAKSPMAKRRSISFRKVFDFPVVLPGRPNVLRIVIEQLAARHDIVPNVKDLMPKAMEIAVDIAANSPQAMALSKEAIWTSLEMGYSQSLEYGWSLLRLQWSHPDFDEGPKAFAEKRAAQWNSNPNARR